MSDAADDLNYPDDLIRKILSRSRVVALVGASANWNRPSYFVMKYLQGKGYRVIPVNPGLAGQTLLGEIVRPDLASVDAPIDIVEIFRRSQFAGAIVDQAIAVGAKTIWMQLGVRDDAAAERARAAGLDVVMNRCLKIEYGRLGGELAWSGVNTGVISSRAPAPPTRKPVREREASAKTDHGFETKAIHAGAMPDASTGARITPIYQTSSYVFEDAEHAASLFNLHNFGHVYTRLSNPTVAVVEERIAALEGGRAAVAAASGHAAQFLTFFTLLEPGDEFIASRNLYGGSLTQFGASFRKLGWTCHFVDQKDPENFKRALTERTKAIFIESLANPGGVVADIEAIARIAEDARIPLVVDNTLATPYLCRPLEWGADIVCHSTTKFLAGHGNSLGGAVVESGKFDYAASGKFPSLAGPEPAYHGLDFFETFGDFAFTMKARAVALRDFGPTLAPMNAFLTIMGVETLPLRMERHVANAARVAEFLESHPAVAWVSYAGLESSPYRDLAKKYLPRGAGSVFTFGLKGGFDAGVELVESVQLFSHLANVGDTRSLILHPASTTHRQLTDEQRLAAGAGPDVIRLSVGLETARDLIEDLDQALRRRAA